MKIEYHPTTDILYVTAESADDYYKVGRMAVKLKAPVYDVTNPSAGKQLQVSLKEVLTILVQ